jgi:hypothetical protein
VQPIIRCLRPGQGRVTLPPIADPLAWARWASHLSTSDCFFGGGGGSKRAYGSFSLLLLPPRQTSIRISQGGSRERNKLGETIAPPYFIPSLTSCVSCNPLPAAVHRDPLATPATELAIAFGVENNPARQLAPSQTSHMAYQSADPMPFMPQGFQRLEVPGRGLHQKSHAHSQGLGSHQHRPLPMDEVHCPNVKDVIHEFLVHHIRVHMRDIQKTHLG